MIEWPKLNEEQAQAELSAWCNDSRTINLAVHPYEAWAIITSAYVELVNFGDNMVETRKKVLMAVILQFAYAIPKEHKELQRHVQQMKKYLGL